MANRTDELASASRSNRIDQLARQCANCRFQCIDLSRRKERQYRPTILLHFGWIGFSWQQPHTTTHRKRGAIAIRKSYRVAVKRGDILRASRHPMTAIARRPHHRSFAEETAPRELHIVTRNGKIVEIEVDDQFGGNMRRRSATGSGGMAG